LDSEYRIIETSRVIWEGKGKLNRPYSHKISSVDADGNRYEHDYQTNGRLSLSKFSSSDGSAEFTRTLRPRSARAGAKGKDDLVVVHTYELSLDRDQPKNYERMTVFSSNGAEVCVEGSSLSGSHWTGYPSATASHGICSNDW
jgi:hypothetical protein